MVIPPPPPPPPPFRPPGTNGAPPTPLRAMPPLVTPAAFAQGTLLARHDSEASSSVSPSPLAGVFINQHVPVVLSLNPPNFSQWRTLFEVQFQKSGVVDHITGPPRPSDATWLQDDAHVVSWLYNRISPEAFGLVHQRGSTAAIVWESICALFLGNREHQLVLLATEFRRIKQGSSSILSYFARLKECADRLADLGERVTDRDQVLNMIRGLHPRYRYAVPILTMQSPFPTLLRCRAFLLLEESRNAEETQPDIALHAGRAPASAPTGGGGSGDHNNRSNGGGRGGGRHRGRGRGSGSGGGHPSNHGGGGAPLALLLQARHLGRDRSTKAVILRSDSSDDLYPLHPTPSPRHHQAFTATSRDVWHRRLGHLGDDALDTTLRRASIISDAAHTTCTDHKGYRCLNRVTGRVVISRHVVFDESTFPFRQQNTIEHNTSTHSDLCDLLPPVDIPRRARSSRPRQPAPNHSPTLAAVPAAGAPPIPEQPALAASTPASSPPSLSSTTSAPTAVATEPTLSPDTAPSSRSPAAARCPAPPPLPTHHMITRAQAGRFFPNPKYHQSLLAATDDSVSPVPKTVRAALRDPNWLAAMQVEYAALMQNRTWSLVPRPRGANIVTGKWLFRHKFKADGSLERYKARWVVRGFSQRPGVDFDETFSPVVKAATIRVVLSVAAAHNWPVHQMDVNNAFLHGHLTERVYCQQPVGFVDASHPDHVCLLDKSLYGLKQAPRAWFARFAAFVRTIGFCDCRSDPSLFVLHSGDGAAYLLLDARGFFLSQRGYAEELLERANMVECKPVSTPVDTHSKLSATDGSPVTDASEYRSLVGALQYLTMTRPDIAYAVQQCCLVMHDPRAAHLALVKRVLRYLRGTTDHGLHLHRSPSLDLVAYSDADWASCPDTRRSTSGYAVFLGDSLVSWSSKRQATVSRSSAEAEYRAVANAVAECCWLRQLLGELRIPLPKATVVFCDNISSVYMAANPVHHRRTKHIELDIHFVREKVALGEFRVLHVPIKQQFADVLTKGLPTPAFQDFRSSLCIRPPDAAAAAGC
ncbi:uncharacterized protein [Aegilops tauschii subsp. strangulata]|uniref:uncharacterized protein n=1 Tax=Aegilops tauschii subsp. strangulata TaxID=200361 RepID=UPI003CC83A3E